MGEDVATEQVVNGSFENELEGWSVDPTYTGEYWIWQHWEGPTWWIDEEQSAFYASGGSGEPLFPDVQGVWQSIDLTGVDTLSFLLNVGLQFWDEFHPQFVVLIDGTTVLSLVDLWDDTSRHEIDVSGYTGVHTVKFGLKFNNGNGWMCLREVSAMSSHVPVPPVADFTAAPLSGDHPLPVQFYDLSTNSPTSWLWDFGDGHLSSAQNPEHIYMAAGSYTVSLRVENDDGWDYKSVPGYITVTEPPPPPPIFFPMWELQIGPLT